MSDIAKKYAVVDTETGKDHAVYDNQAPATRLAKGLSYARTMIVEERVYAFVSKTVVRTVRNCVVVKG